VGVQGENKVPKGKPEIRSQKRQNNKSQPGMAPGKGIEKGWHRESYQCTIHARSWCTVECGFTTALIKMIRLVIGISDWSIIMIGLGGQLVVHHLCAVPVSVLIGGVEKKIK
jgi:hypothetical protein